MDKKLYYLCVVKDQIILADFMKGDTGGKKANFQQFTNGILARMATGTYKLPYNE